MFIGERHDVDYRFADNILTNQKLPYLFLAAVATIKLQLYVQESRVN